jgi:hypothetical protein
MGGGVLAVLGSEKIHYGGAGPLGLIVAAFIASCGWHANSANEKVCFKFYTTQRFHC